MMKNVALLYAVVFTVSGIKVLAMDSNSIAFKVDTAITSAAQAIYKDNAQAYNLLNSAYKQLSRCFENRECKETNGKLSQVLSADFQPNSADCVNMWENLSDIVVILKEQLSASDSSAEDKTLLPQTTLLYALVSKGLSRELCLTLQYSDDLAVAVKAEQTARNLARIGEYELLENAPESFVTKERMGLMERKAREDHADLANIMRVFSELDKK